MLEFYEKVEAIKRLYAKMSAPVEAKYGLTHLEFRILMFLANHPGRDTATEIVEKEQVCKSYVSVSVRALQERGFLRGSCEKNDRRTVHLTICETAAPIVSEGHEAQREFANILLKDFTEADKEAFRHCMKLLDRNLKAAI